MEGQRKFFRFSVYRCKAKKPPVFFLAGFLLIILLSTIGSAGARQEEEKITPSATSFPDMVMWEKAMDFLETGDGSAASSILLEMRELYPESAMAQDALWRAAQIMKAEALAAEEPDWNAVRAAFKRFSSDYPDSSHTQEAFLEVGITHYRMRYFREGLIYLNMFLKRYPDAIFIDQAIFWKVKALFAMGRMDEGRRLLEKFSVEAERALRIKVAGLYFESGLYQNIFSLYDELKKGIENYSKEDFYFMRLMGLSHLRIGNEKKGRELLYKYYNVVESDFDKNEVLFAIAESYYREKNRSTALKLYKQIIASAEEEEREAVLARFRLAQHLDDPTVKRADWQRPSEPTDLEADEPYNAVLKQYGNEPIAQAARFGLFLRFLARDDFEDARHMGRKYLENAEEDNSGQSDMAGDIVLALIEGLFQRGEYKKVYDLYRLQYRHVTDLASGHLLSLVGQSLEALALLDQAVVVYYRALALPLDEEEKTELYFRRARVYLQKNDLDSARRLLSFLLRAYEGQKEFAETLYLAGKLREAQGAPEDALKYFEQAIGLPEKTERQAVYVMAHLQCLFNLSLFESFSTALNRYQQEERLSAEELQNWHGRFGHLWWRSKDYDRAEAAYRAAVAEGMPLESNTAQAVHFFLGDILLKKGDVESGRNQLELAAAGSEEQWKELASRRLQEESIDEAALELLPLLQKAEGK